VLLHVNDSYFDATGITSDSRAVAPGFAFVAIRGTQVDGHAYIEQALKQGATTIICEDAPDSTLLRQYDNIKCVQVDNSAAAWGRLSSEWFGDPSRALKLVGVTGTNGKTTIATLLYELFSSLGNECGLISTVANYVVRERVATSHTTPDAYEINELLARMVKAGCEYAFMEVSSHAAAQGRIAGLAFDGAIFTNLTRDHLDYHKTFEAYRDAKKSFFDMLSADAFALVNKDDANGMYMLRDTEASKLSYAIDNDSASYNGNIKSSALDGMDIAISYHGGTLTNSQGEVEYSRDCLVHTRLVGGFNAYNVMAICGAALELGVRPEQLSNAFPSLEPAPGRFDVLHSAKGWAAIVDYAHTPDALQNVLDAINGLKGTDQRVVTVVGCGGNRDAGKRPQMARIAVDSSDFAIFTSDNPRLEEPDAIIDDMWAGLNDAQREGAKRVCDRHDAIHDACAGARSGDIILVAGKGHEDYQDARGVKRHFDDKEEIGLWL
jgi:UDP-N-acetylmuramoyl-L-alanyl-D-glutamate--2,6-diaminopimelate ligase